MSTYTQILYQIVFGTKYRALTLTKTQRPELFHYISGLIISRKCKLYCINGIENHIHIITHLHPSVSLSSLVKDIKLASSKYIKEQKLFPLFNGWQVGYSAFTYSQEAKKNLINYVRNQETHHRKTTFMDEYYNLLKKHGLEYDENFPI